MNRHNQALAVLIGITCLFFYALFWSGTHYSIDGVVMFEYSKALIFQHSFSMNPPVIWGKDVFTVSKWAIGQTLIYIPSLWALSETIFAKNPAYTQIPYDPELRRNPALLENTSYLSVSYINALITTTTVVFFFLLLIDLGLTKRKASVIALLFGVTSPSAVYAKLDFAQPLAALWIVLSFYLLNKAQQQENKWNYLLSGVTLGCLVITRTEMVVFQIPIMVVTTILIQIKNIKKPILSRTGILNITYFFMPIIFITVVNQYINYLRFGGLFSTGYNAGSMFKPDFLSLLGNLISPGRGLFIFFPLAWLSILSISKLHKNIILWSIFISAFGAVIFYSIFNDGWAAGLSWGPRLLIPYLPLFTVLSYFGYESIKQKNHHLSVIILTLLVFMGSIFTLQGLLFNWLRFYGSLHLTTQDIVEGLYHFSISYSPILSGWGQLMFPEKYDIYWFQHPTGLHRFSIVAAMGIAFILGVLLMIWIRIIRESILE